jgi:hypothetical protein
LSSRWIVEQLCFQQSDASAHFTLTAWISQWTIYRPFGYGSETSPLPLSQPVCSPDLAAPGNSMWGITKDKVALRCCDTVLNYKVPLQMPSLLWHRKCHGRCCKGCEALRSVSTVRVPTLKMQV